MKPSLALAAAAAAWILALPGQSLAQGAVRDGYGRMYMYNPQTVETVANESRG